MEENMVDKREVKVYILKWLKDKLNIHNVRLEENLLNIGLDSFSAVQLICDIEDKFGTMISMKDILQNPSINKITKAISKGKKKEKRIVEKEISRYPLTAQQIAIYIASIKSKGKCLYNIPVKLVLPKSIDITLLEKSIKELLEIHCELNVELEEGEGKVFFKKSATNINIEKYLDENEVDDFFRPFDLSNPPFIRIGLTKKYLLMDFHHIIVDGKSIHILVKELDDIYQGKYSSKKGILYYDYAKMIDKYVMRDGFKEVSQYFAEVINNGRRVHFGDINRNKESNLNGKSSLYHLNQETRKHIQFIKDTYSLTNTMTFFSLFCILLKKYTNQNDLLTSITLMNRLYKDVLNTVGMFVNTLPLKIPDKNNLNDFIADIKDKVLNLYSFQEVPLMEAIKDANIKSTDINTSFIYQANGINKFYFNGELCNAEWVELNVTKFDLTFEITEEIDGYTLRIEYNVDKFSQKMIDAMFVDFEKIIKQICKAENISDIRLYEINNIFFNYTIENTFDSAKCVHQLFTETAYNNKNLAIVFENKCLTYEQVENYSNSLAYFLQINENIKKNTILPIIAERSWELIVAMIAILKIGCAFLLIEPTCPEGRKEKILTEINAKKILTKGYDVKGRYKNINLENNELWNNSKKPCIIFEPEGVCYLIYTSGSTGSPKGILISHENVVNYCSRDQYSLWERCFNKQINRIVSVTNISFDIFITESLFALINGMTIYMTSKLSVNSPKLLNELICKNEIQILQTTPSKMKLYLMDEKNLEYLKHLKVILLGGEKVDENIYMRLQKLTDAKIFNVYGPAETTVWVTCKELKGKEINIGTSLSNNRVYIMSDNLEICPIGVVGEICIAGKNVGMGYFNNKELTKKKFKENPYKKGEVIYLTGDLGKVNYNGEIEYVGRKDNQVKLNGIRIELEEIEEVMSNVEGVISVAVKLQKKATRDFLVAFYVSGKLIQYTEWQRELENQLMNYMIPSYFVRVSFLPMSPNGKIDRKSLPDYYIDKMNDEIINKPSNMIEEKVSREICKLLKLPQIDTKDNILELGMDSLAIMQLAAILDDGGLYVDIQKIIEFPTVVGISNIIMKKNKIKKFYANVEKKIDILLNSQFNEAQDRKLGTVLLTGVTGFLGAHLMKGLIDFGVKKIICPIRKKEEDIYIKFQKTVKYYFPLANFKDIEERVVLIECDLENDDYTHIFSEKINTIIHAAAQVKHYGQNEDFHRINVEVTKKLLRYAKLYNVFFVYISTLSVSGNSSLVYENHEKTIFTEKNLGIGQEIDNIYAQSKYEAERQVLYSVLNGQSCIIIRVGNLTNRRYDLKFQKNYQDNAFLSRIRAIILLKCFPKSWLEEKLEFTPVDEATNAIMIICKRGGENQIIYHVYNDKTLTYRKLLLLFDKLGIGIVPVDDELFKEKLFEYAEKNKNSRILQSLIGIMDRKGNFRLSNHIEVSNHFSSFFLIEQGFEWKSVDENYLKRYLEYFLKLDYFK